MIRHRFQFLTVGVLCLVAAALPGSAQTIYSNLDSSNGFNTSTGWCVNGSAVTTCHDGLQTVAARFQAAATLTLSTINLALFYTSGTNSVTVTLSTDGVTQPGTQLEQWTLTNVPSVSTLLTVRDQIGLSITGGKYYWLTVAATSSDGIFGFNFNDVGVDDVWFNFGGSWVEQATSSAPAFSVLGSTPGSGTSCTAFVANQPTMRQESVAEPAGDVLLQCTGALVGAQTGQQSLTLTVNNAAITSRQLYTGGPPSSIPTEATLLVNDCTTNSGTSPTGASCSPSGTFQGGTPTQGYLQSGALVFSGFTLPTTGQPYQIRVTNLRVNANSLASGKFVTAGVSSTLPVQNNANLVLGAVQSSLSVAVPTPPAVYLNSLVTTNLNVVISELVRTAFKAPASVTANSTPGQWYQSTINTESQTVLSVPAAWSDPLGAVPGRADSGTRFRLNISSLPAGVTVTLPISVNNGTDTLTATTSDTLPFSQVSGNSIVINSPGGSVTYEVRSQSPTSLDSFVIAMTANFSGTVGLGTVLVSATYAPTSAEITNLNPAFGIPRFADTSVLTPLFTIAPIPTCTYTLSPTSGAAPAAGATSSAPLSVAVMSPISTCIWPNSSSPVSWVTPTSATGEGTGVVDFSVAPNTLSAPRSTTLTVAGQPFPLTQAGMACQITGLTPSSTSVGSGGTTNSTFAVNITPSDCKWTAAPSSTSAFVTTSPTGNSGTGPGNVTYSVSSNGTGTARSGTINVSAPGTQAFFNITQAATAPVTCTYSLAPSTASFPGTFLSGVGNTGFVTLNSQGVCKWTASSSATWLVITAGLTGQGSGAVNYSLTNNPSNLPRSATLTIAGQTFVVTQAGAASTVTCTATLPNGVPQVLLEGRTEVVGSLQLACTGLTSALTADIVLTLNTNVTNTLTATNLTDSTLNNGEVNSNGQVLSYTTLHWPGTLLTPSGGNATLQINNVRADASLLAGMPITGEVSVYSTVPVPITNSSLTLATVSASLAFLAGSTSQVSAGEVQTVSYQEVSPTAFQTASGSTPATAFRIVVSNIPSGIIVYAPLFPVGGSKQGQLFTADCSGAGGLPVTPLTSGVVTLSGTSYYPLTPNSAGVATATWEVLSATSGIDTLTFPMLATGSSSSVAWNTIQVEGSYAPVTPAGPACGTSDPSATVVPSYRDFNVPQQFSYLQLAPSVTAQPVIVLASGALTMLFTVANTGNQTWIGSVNSDLLTSGGPGSIQITCQTTGADTCSSTGGQTTWNTSIPAGQTMNYFATGQLQGGIPQSLTNLTGLSASYTPPVQTVARLAQQAINAAGFSPCGAVACSPKPGPVDPTPFVPLPPQMQIYTQSQTVTSSSATVTVTGFAASSASIANVQIFLNGSSTPVATLTPGSGYGLPNDPNGYCSTTTFMNSPDCLNGGKIDFSYSLPASLLSSGPNTLTAEATDVTGAQVVAPNSAFGSNSPIILTYSPGPVITISGTVTNTATGGPLSQVTINLTGTQSGSMTTSLSGGYSFPNLPTTGSYTLSAAASGYSFTSTTPFPITNPSTNQTVNFSGTPTTGTGGNPLDFYPITPCRVADTRVSTYPSGFGPPSFGAGETRTYNVLSSPCAAGIPSSVQAYSLNFTVVPPAGGPAGNLTTWPVGLPSMPVVSTLNYSNSVVANAAVVPAGTNGAIDVYVNDPTNVLFDINGYFAPPGAASSGLEFFPVTPCRIADTRVSSFPSGFGPPSFGAGETRAYAIPLSLCGPGIPSSVAAYSLNFTVVPPSGGPAANLTTWPVGLASMPNVSTLNFSSNIVANAAIVPAGTTGNEGIDVYVNDPTNVLFDINGYFAPLTSGLHFYPITPCRVADTRVPAGFTGQFGPPSFTAGQTRQFNILSSSCAAKIPLSVAAYSLNFTVIPPAGGPAANLTTWPVGLATMPNVSTLNFYGNVVANAAIVPSGTSGAINVYVNLPTDVLFDINGYFAP